MVVIDETYPEWIQGLTGARVTIAVLDSGLSRQHPALRDIDVSEIRSFTGENPSVDMVGHGTQSCSVLLAQPGFGVTKGIATGITFFFAQIIDCRGTGSAKALIAALEWITQLRPDVVAIPCGRLTGCSDVDDALTQLIDTGAVIFAPCGNPYAGQFDSLYPASHPGIISVGAYAYLSTYKQWAKPPDIVLPAHDINVCSPSGGIELAGGTSLAAVIAAGYACLMIQTSLYGDYPNIEEYSETLSRFSNLCWNRGQSEKA